MAAAVAMLVLAGVGVTAFAATNTVFYAGYIPTTRSRTKMSLNAPSTCGAGETAVSWSQVGPQGLAGPSGPRGATGPTGPAGRTGAQGPGYRLRSGIVTADGSMPFAPGTFTPGAAPVGISMPLGGAWPASATTHVVAADRSVTETVGFSADTLCQ